jgi:hypothetical protein
VRFLPRAYVATLSSAHSQESRRRPGNNGHRCNVFRYNRIGTNDGTVTDVHTWQHHNSRSQPDIRADRNKLDTAGLLIDPQSRQDAMIVVGDEATWGDHCMRTDRDISEDIDFRAATDKDMVA